MRYSYVLRSLVIHNPKLSRNPDVAAESTEQKTFDFHRTNYMFLIVASDAELNTSWCI